MEVTYEAEDGYVGGSRPKYVDINDEEIKDCESDDEAMRLVEDAIQEHFEQNVAASYDYKKLLEEVKQLRSKA